jgi:hypothetical protein
MFRSLSYCHPQESSFVLSALPLLRLFASSFALFGVWLYVVYVYVCPVYLSVGCLVVFFRIGSLLVYPPHVRTEVQEAIKNSCS